MNKTLSNKVIDQHSDRTSDMHSRVRRVLQHHKLTEVGNGVVEADLIEAVLDSLKYNAGVEHERAN